MDRDLTGPDRHRSPLDPPRIRTGPPWPESADPFRPCPPAAPTPTTRPSTTKRLTTKASTDPLSPQLSASREGGYRPDCCENIL
jgi:hypothetical protein